MTHAEQQNAYYERNLVRLLIALFYCGKHLNNLFEGETRQIDSIRELQRFDFWMREPGHLALALLHARAAGVTRLADNDSALRAALDRMLDQDAVDVHRVPPSGGSIFENLNDMLSFLASRALVSDRPSFMRTKQSSHQVVLEEDGIAFVAKVFESCPSFGWYKAQAETIFAYFSVLEGFDLSLMAYLAPDLNTSKAAAVRLAPYVRRRYQSVFGELPTPVVIGESHSVDV